jgi:long-chain acyl-CoA synthetase
MAHLTKAVAERKGGDAALIDEYGETTWSELDGRINRLIHAFRDRGLTTGDTIALMCGNRREFFEVTLASGHAGLIVVPVNWHWVADELAYVLDDSDAAVLIVEDRYAAVAAEACADDRAARCSTRIVIGQPAPDGFTPYETFVAGGSADEPDGQCSGGPMFYTSGTTGFPKGVRSSVTATGHDPAVVAMVAQVAVGMLHLPADGVTLLEGPAYHSAQWALSVLPLIGAASTVVMRHHFDPAETLALIDRYQVTNIHLVPTQFIRLLKLPDEVRAAFDGRSLQSVVHGAAPCPVEVKRKMLDWWGPVITEYYGGTEGGFLTIVTGPEWMARPGTLGRPTNMTELMIVSEDGTACAAGESGQIYFKSLIGADFTYHKAPEKTEAAHRAPGVGTLGDIGYVDDDGYLFMSDRKIDMIISGGVNIYPAEIEGILVGHPAVADAAVFGIPDDEMGEQVKAAVELTAGITASDDLAAELVAYARQHLAGYKAPKTIDFEEHLPRQPTGKIYKRLLRDPYWEASGRTI